MCDVRTRCGWCTSDDLYIAYHDREWGVPVHDDKKLFEFLVLESAQAGLSWRTILGKRSGYRRLFADFDPQAVARFGDADLERLVLDPAIVRNRAKIKATVQNARAFLQVQERHGSFAKWQWDWVDGRPLVNHWHSLKDLPASTDLSDRMAKELKKLGFSFLGSTVVYAHLQATGVVNDHLVSCFRHRELV
ncbi:MAG: DNA-3-methyladenine glycosylase I [Deltaproteobacteria bacterium]|nr:DNA-3-methyladenine glycosylase I [Deltaproteobacteria bacterium]